MNCAIVFDSFGDDEFAKHREHVIRTGSSVDPVLKGCGREFNVGFAWHAHERHGPISEVPIGVMIIV